MKCQFKRSRVAPELDLRRTLEYSDIPLEYVALLGGMAV